jgi:hypothetical protein
MSWTTFLGLAAAFTGENINLARGEIESSLSEYSNIWYNFEYWFNSLVFSLLALVFGLIGLGKDTRNSGWKLSDFIKIEIIEDEEEN